MITIIYSQFKLYGVAPVVFVNVLDPAKHKKSVAEQNYPVADGKVLLPLEALKNTVKVTNYTAGTDYGGQGCFPYLHDPRKPHEGMRIRP